MALYWTCKYGINHDCGERCDCEEEMEREKEKMKRRAIKMQSMYRTESNGQMVIAV